MINLAHYKPFNFSGSCIIYTDIGCVDFSSLVPCPIVYAKNDFRLDSVPYTGHKTVYTCCMTASFKKYSIDSEPLGPMPLFYLLRNPAMTVEEVIEYLKGETSLDLGLLSLYSLDMAKYHYEVPVIANMFKNKFPELYYFLSTNNLY